MGRIEVTKTRFREENFGDRRKGFGFEEGNICKAEGLGSEEGGVQGYVFGEKGVGEGRGNKGSKSYRMEGSEQENRGNDNDIDGIIEEEWNIDEEFEVDDEDDITGVIKLIEIKNPEFDGDMERTKEIRRSTKKRKKLADELSELLFLMA